MNIPSLNPQPPIEIGIVEISKLDEKSQINGQILTFTLKDNKIKYPIKDTMICTSIDIKKTLITILFLLNNCKSFNRLKILTFFEKLKKNFFRIKGTKKNITILVKDITSETIINFESNLRFG